MMKKLLCIVLSLLMLLSFTACNDNKNESDKTDDKTEASEQNDSSLTSESSDFSEVTDENSVSEDNSTEDEVSENEEPESKYDWTLKDLSAPTFAKLTVEEVESNGKKYKIKTTPFSYNIEDFKTVVSSSELLNEYYPNIGSRTKETMDSYMDEGKQYFGYDVEDSIVGFKKDYLENKSFYPKMELILKTETYEYSNYYLLEFSFDGLPITKETQSEISRVLSECIGSEYAEYLVYAKDPDGSPIGNGRLEEGYLSEQVESDGRHYNILRHISIDDEYPEETSLWFKIYLEDNGFGNSFTTYDGGYVGKYFDAEYNLNSLLPDIPDITYADCSNFASNYFKEFSSNYTASQRIVGFDFEVTEMPDGTKIYYYNSNPGSLDIEYDLVVQNGEVLDIDLEIRDSTKRGKETGDRVEAYKAMMKLEQEMLLFIFPTLDFSDVDIESITEDKNKTQYSYGEIELLGKKCEYRIDLAVGTSFVGYGGDFYFHAELAEN